MHHIMARFWWILAVRGILGLLLGATAMAWIWSLDRPSLDWLGWALFKPTAIVVSLIFFVGLYAFMDGLFAVVLGVQDYGDGRRWGAMIIEGVVSVLLGLSTWFWPSAIFALLYGICVWAVLTGILEIAQGLDLNEYKERRGPFFLEGICSIFFGAAIALFHSGVTVVWLMGGFAFLSGIPLTILALRLRPFSKVRRRR